VILLLIKKKENNGKDEIQILSYYWNFVPVVYMCMCVYIWVCMCVGGCVRARGIRQTGTSRLYFLDVSCV